MPAPFTFVWDELVSTNPDAAGSSTRRSSVGRRDDGYGRRREVHAVRSSGRQEPQG